MPPRRKKKTALQTYASVDTPEIVALATGYARQGYYGEGYDRARLNANAITARALSVPDGTRNARYAYMTGIRGEHGRGEFVVGITTPDVLKQYGIHNEASLRKEFKNNIQPANPNMPGFKTSLVRGFPLMKTYHHAAHIANLPSIAAQFDETADGPRTVLHQLDIDEIISDIYNNY